MTLIRPTLVSPYFANAKSNADKEESKFVKLARKNSELLGGRPLHELSKEDQLTIIGGRRLRPKTSPFEVPAFLKKVDWVAKPLLPYHGEKSGPWWRRPSVDRNKHK